MVDDSDLYVYVSGKDKNRLYIMQEGSGCNIVDEDLENGYDSYIDYTVYIYDGDDIYRDFMDYEDNDFFVEEDGGDYLYRSEENKKWTDYIEDVMRFDMDYEDREKITYIFLSERLA